MSPVRSSRLRRPLPVSPFVMLADLLEGMDPGGPVIDMTVGEPRHPMPDFLMEALEEAKEGFGKYPPIRGTDEFRDAVRIWLGQRYPVLKEPAGKQMGIIPLAGTREGLFHVVFAALARRPETEKPAILIPNPFYHTYAGAAGAAGAEAVFLSAGPDTEFLPDLDEIGRETLDRTAAMFLCSPANPQGSVASLDYLKKAVELARSHDFLLIADECYSEVYTEEPPPGVLEAAMAAGSNLSHVITLQSLSKRSNLPGLRIGFCAGDPDFVEAFASFRNVLAPQVPIPVMHACARLLGDEAHVEQSRDLYRQKFDAADRILGNRYGYQRPGGGFFLWLDVGAYRGSEQAVTTLWKGCGVKLLPGRYLARDDSNGVNPGENYVRVAMVHDLTTTEDALTRITETLK